MNLLQTCIPVVITLGLLAVAYFINALLARRSASKEAHALFDKAVESARAADAVVVPFKMTDASTVEPTAQAFASKASLRAKAKEGWEAALPVAIKARAYFLAARLCNNLGFLAISAEEVAHAKARFNEALSFLQQTSDSGKAALSARVQANLESVALWTLFEKGMQQAQLDHAEAKIAARSGSPITAASYASCTATYAIALIKATASGDNLLLCRVLHETALVDLRLNKFQAADAMVREVIRLCEANALNPLAELGLLDQIQQQEMEHVMAAIHAECFAESEQRDEEIRRACAGLMLHANRLGQNGDHIRAVEQARKALAKAEPLGPLHLTTAEALRTLGQMLVGYGDIEEARPILLRARFAAGEHPTEGALLAQIEQALSYCAGA